MKLKTIIATALLVGAPTVWAADCELAPVALNAEAGSKVDLSVNMKIDDFRAVSFQFDLYLPDGVTVDVDEYDTPIATLATDRIADHIVNAAVQADGAVRYLSYSNNNRVYKGADGVVLTTPLVITAAPGTYEIAIRGGSLTHEGDFVEYFTPETTATLTVTAADEVRYGDNQLYVRDITVNKGETAQMQICYNSTSDVYEYSADITLPAGVTASNVTFDAVVADVANYSNEWSFAAPILKVNGEYGGRRDVPAEGGNQVIATATIDTSSLEAGEYGITVGAQFLSNDDNDFSPEAYVAKLKVVGSIEPEPLKQCAAPVLTIEYGRIKGYCATPGARIHTTVVAEDHQTFHHANNEIVPLTGVYNITTYAEADGMTASDPVKYKLAWVMDYDNSTTDIETVSTRADRPIAISSNGMNFSILGTQPGEPIEVYDLNGVEVFNGEAETTSFTIPVDCRPGTVYVIVIGSTSIKAML